MKKWIFPILLLILFLFPNQEVLAQDSGSFCLVYFTYIGCPNCAYTDPVVLTEWPQKYPNLVVIEYMWYGGDWQDPNSQFFGKYASAYRTQAAVPQIVIDKNIIRLGRIDVPKAENDIEKKEFNPCPLIDKSISFGELDLRQLPAKPKIWANQRILISLGENQWLFQWNGRALSQDIIGKENMDNELVKSLLFTDNISKLLKGKSFEIVSPQKAEFSGIAFPRYDVIPYAEFENAIKISPVRNEISNGVSISEKPVEEIPPESLVKEEPIEEPIKEEIELPLFGKIKTGEFSLPLLTGIFAIADGLTNPCGFFVLFFLVGALIGLAGAKKRIFLVGSIFILFFILYYFLFMALLLNIFLLGKKLVLITTIAGLVCIIAGILNIKDYFFLGKGPSFSLSEKKKAGLSEKVRKLSLAQSNKALIVGSVVVASGVSLVAIACTFGLPLAYTKILSASSLSSLQYYLYLVLYNLIYAIPMLGIVSIIAITLGKAQFGETWIKRLKLISGFIILFLGFILLYKYILLENVGFILWLMFSALVVSGLIILIKEVLTKKFKKEKF